MKLSLTEVECESLQQPQKKNKKNTSELRRKLSFDGKKMLACQTETKTASAMLSNMLKKMINSIHVHYLLL